MPNPTAGIMAAAPTEQLKEYLLGFTEEAALLAMQELIKRGEDPDQIIKMLEAEIQPSLDHGMAMKSCVQLIAALKNQFSGSSG